MRRRKQFLAFSMAAAMVVGIMGSPFTLSSVQAAPAEKENVEEVVLAGTTTEKGSINFSALEKDASNVIAAGEYGDDVLKVTFFGKGMDYLIVTPSKGFTSGSYSDSIKTKQKGSVTAADGAVTAVGAVKLVSAKDAEVTVSINKTSGVMHLPYFENGELKEDKYNEALLADSSDELTFDVEAGKEYYLWSESQNMQIFNISYTYTVESTDPVDPVGPVEFPEGQIPAFPGAEGGGMYATGGRGGDVYVVTNLNDSGEGSLRYGVETAPAAGRIIVFDVGGTIHLKSTLTFKNKANITIAGQTAPGDGITIAGYDTNISDSENIVIRFVRFRVGTENLLNGGDSMDALWGRDNDTFIIDHCSFSWNTDETLSTYRGKNGTVQWCIISESLTVSGHSKGRHGYGGIFGGDNTVFQYNLMTNHTSRNPRIGGGSMTDPTNVKSYATLQLSNNVLYNHGYFPCYGGGFAYTNYINNYVKQGPGTREFLKNVLIHVGENNKDGGFYVAGNILEGNDAITIDNSKGVVEDTAGYISQTAYTAAAFDQITLRSASEAYPLVLGNAGATYPYRDAIDARVVAQVTNGTGAFINTQDEVGGYPARTVTAEDVGRTDSDGDGIPDAWETAHGLDPNDASDSNKPASATKGDDNYGYAWIEVYFNDLVKDVVKTTYTAENPSVSIDLADNTLADEGTDVTVTAAAAANNGGSIAKVEFYNGAELAGTVSAAPFTYTYTGLVDGTYSISVRAYDNEGNATQSDTSKLHVNSTAGTGSWLHSDVGAPGVAGTASLKDGVLTVKGAGKLGSSEGSVSGSVLNNAATDDFHYVYQQMNGNVEIVTKLNSYTAVDNHTFNGLMFRESLDAGSAAVGVGLTMTKIFDGDTTTWAAIMVNRAEKDGAMSDISETIDSESGAEAAGIPIVHGLNFKTGNTFNGVWLKLTRIGNNFTASVSEDGLEWKTVGTIELNLPETVYAGFAVEAGKAANKLENYATAKFSDIAINTDFGLISYELENLDYSGADHFAIGEDVVVTLSNVKGYLLPSSVEVLCNGASIPCDYNPETGTVYVKNPSGDITIKASGVKREIVMVDYEVIDENNLLTVEKVGEKIILTQAAESGNVAKNINTPAQNESFILFPAVNQCHEFTLDIKVTNLTNAGDATGVFVGMFTDDNAFNTLGLRPAAKPAEAVCAYWTKSAEKVGNGSPKAPLLDGVYSIQFTKDKSGQYVVNWTAPDGTKYTKTFKSNECYIKKGDTIRYGIGLIGATVEITNMKLVDHEDNVIYTQPKEQTNPGSEESVRAFAGRLYTLVLGREAEEAGLNDWTDALLGGRSNGVDVGYGFVFSDECKDRNLSNEDFVEMLYNTFMDRPSDEGGKAAWVAQLEAGVEREKILEGFIMSQEFAGICEEFGIAVGNVESVDAFAEALSHYCNQNADITMFVARCYTEALGRAYDPVGLEDWCRVIINQEDTPKAVAQCFIFSDEFVDKNLSNEDYIKVLYRTFLGREADEGGLAAWINVLESGEEDRAKVLEGFSDSEEFAGILESFGLK